MKLYRFALLFFDGTVITGKLCVGVPLTSNLSIYLSIPMCTMNNTELLKIHINSTDRHARRSSIGNTIINIINFQCQWNISVDQLMYLQICDNADN